MLIRVHELSVLVRVFSIVSIFLVLKTIPIESVQASVEEELRDLVLKVKGDLDEFTLESRELFLIGRKLSLANRHGEPDLRLLELSLRKTLDAWRAYDKCRLKLIDKIHEFNEAAVDRNNNRVVLGASIGGGIFLIGVVKSLIQKEINPNSAAWLAIGYLTFGILPHLLNNTSEEDMAMRLRKETERLNQKFMVRLEQIIEIYSLLANQPDSTLRADYPWVEEMGERLLLSETK